MRPWNEKCLLYGMLVTVLLGVIANFVFRWNWNTPGFISEPLPEYDYIIVGAGTAGCVLARRLWEKCQCKILVVEAGGMPPYASSIPLVAPALQMTATDWAFKTVPQRSSHWGMNNQLSHWPRGRVVGGSSTINYLVHMWATASDFDSYAAITEDESWSYDNIKQYFKRVESYDTHSGKEHTGYRGSNGPIAVQEISSVPLKLANAFVEGAISLGLKPGDLNGDIVNGVMLAQSNVKNGQRVSAYNAYLSPIIHDSGISMLLNTMATKILFHERKAAGIELVNSQTNRTHRVTVTQEVIVCAGAVGSPHLLMLSGIGPAEDLKKFQLPIIIDLPGVGRNLRDHLNLPMYFHLDSPVSLTTSKARSFAEVWKYFAQGQGYLSHSGVEVVARIPLPKSNSSKPDIYYLLLNIGSIDENIFKKVANFQYKAFVESFPETHNKSKEGFVLLVACSYPKSCGSIRLVSANPFVYPEIDPNYLDEEEDVKYFLEAMRMGARLGTTKSLQAFGVKLHLPGYKECASFGQSLDSDEYMECWLRTSAMTGYHPMGTCAVGKDGDPLAVLDSHFRVRNVQNLRVVDASALPHPTAGTPHATVAVLAELAAERISESHSPIPS